MSGRSKPTSIANGPGSSASCGIWGDTGSRRSPKRARAAASRSPTFCCRAPADLGADMIVAGAYHHSQLRESLLGGVSRDLLDHMMVPVLMSH